MKGTTDMAEKVEFHPSNEVVHTFTGVTIFSNIRIPFETGLCPRLPHELNVDVICEAVFGVQLAPDEGFITVAGVHLAGVVQQAGFELPPAFWHGENAISLVGAIGGHGTDVFSFATLLIDRICRKCSGCQTGSQGEEGGNGFYGKAT
jgi:hypothetical protein